MTIDVVRALDLLETCAAEADAEERNLGDRPSHRRTTLTTRALAKLDVVHLGAASGQGLPARANGPERPGSSFMTLGAMIVFRSAHRFGRAGASTQRALDAAYCAAQRYQDLLPSSLLDGVDTQAITARLRATGRQRLTRANNAHGLTRASRGSATPNPALRAT